MYAPWGWSKDRNMLEHSKCFSVKILDYYNITVHLLVCDKLSESIMHGATIKIFMYRLQQKHSSEHNSSSITYGSCLTFFWLFDDTVSYWVHMVHYDLMIQRKESVYLKHIYWSLWGTTEIFPCKFEGRMAVLYLDIKYSKESRIGDFQYNNHTNYRCVTCSVLSLRIFL